MSKVKFKENSTVAKYSGELQDFEYTIDDFDILIKFNNIYDNSIMQLSLGGLVMTEDNDFIMEDEQIRLIQRNNSYLTDNITIMIFKQTDEGEAL
jgi:hypothetical protein